jgi:hypothetical protein
VPALGCVRFNWPLSCSVRESDAGFFAFHLDTWLVMHEDLRHSKAYKTVFDMLATGLQAYINNGVTVSHASAQR